MTPLESGYNQTPLRRTVFAQVCVCLHWKGRQEEGGKGRQNCRLQERKDASSEPIFHHPLFHPIPTSNLQERTDVRSIPLLHSQSSSWKCNSYMDRFSGMHGHGLGIGSGSEGAPLLNRQVRIFFYNQLSTCSGIFSSSFLVCELYNFQEFALLILWKVYFVVWEWALTRLYRVLLL